ncbi:MAG: single-stranded DNA-binding protein [Candidatus Nealsonbacteria bacterium]|nr:MAG: single-stranded DNA-binding protein [Candidatus Nealsonbacteria bacterium]
MINKVILIGFLGSNPEINYTSSSLAIARFSVATSETWKDKSSGKKKEKTEWHRIVAFGRLAEICGDYLTKGSQVYIEGRLQTSSWEKDGVTRYSTDIIANEMKMLGGGAGRQERSGHSRNINVFEADDNQNINNDDDQNINDIDEQGINDDDEQGINDIDDIPF